MPDYNHRGGTGKIKIVKHEGKEFVMDDKECYNDEPTAEDRKADEPTPGDDDKNESDNTSDNCFPTKPDPQP